MLTLAVENPPVPRRSRLADGAVRVAAASVLIGSVIGVGYLAAVAWVDHSWFGDWQPVLIALLAAVVLVGLGLCSWFVLRSRQLVRRTSYLRLTLLALVPGLLLGIYISGFMVEGVVSDWIRHSPFGNPAAPGVLRLTSAPAPLPLASRMLTPTDLGAGWYTRAKPNPSLMPTSSQETSEGQLVRVKDFIDSDHWTGSVWRNDGTTSEVLLHFDSVTDAQNYPAVWKAQDASVVLSPRTVGQTVVLEGVTAAGWRFASFAVGDNYFEVQEDNIDAMPTIAQFRAIVDAAVARATSATSVSPAA
jgi:hypothetical protein